MLLASETYNMEHYKFKSWFLMNLFDDSTMLFLKVYFVTFYIEFIEY